MKRFDILFVLGIVALIGDVAYKIVTTKILRNQLQLNELEHTYFDSQNLLNIDNNKRFAKIEKQLKKLEGANK